ncbi:MAG: cytochrome b N-terminal domain-containing protein [Chloroflexi bacterium]|uniref:Cytochrome b N-terminal domain-containing protein n=1 Tax=Candidatus Chlorohelix allophototropha TaxID=3003348 RepID=A0A8T7LX92_9CHLR|nr:cytochrome b N-terminal domain-containing protein [Chloroflexota bacterium]WJW67456.1 cytochrome b N-terminal domain-containing protein [Chloroflexota bacterium L227-S17]
MNLTGALRKKVSAWMPLEDLLPDELPAYVRSPAYFFGVAALSSMVLLILSGIVLAIFGPHWWHADGVGHFVNSLHFWCSELFFFTLTLHLWTEFFKGSWRHGRRLTWVVGGIGFALCIGTAFTGYLSQTNFSSQWIGVEAKDALNATGIGAFFNVLNFGQIYGFHIMLLPLILVLLVGFHLLQVRIRGVVRPYAAKPQEEREVEKLWKHKKPKKGSTANEESPPMPSDQRRYYRGVRMMPYDLIREGLFALLGVFIVSVVLAAIFSSPDEPPLTLQSYSQQSPVPFITTAMNELSGVGEIGQYGPPYNNSNGAVQSIGSISLQTLAGVTVPVDVAKFYVLEPLSIAAISDPDLASALQTFSAASDKQQADWEDAYTKALPDAKVSSGNLVLADGDYGPLPVMMNRLLGLGTSGALDGLLLRSGGFYQNDFTKPLLFLSEDALSTRAEQLNLLGSQWGMMNETGNYPGQAWLWLYTFWYQVPPFNTSSNADLLVSIIMAILTAILIFLPFLPFINRVPYYLGIHRLIWREYYKDVKKAQIPEPV